MASRKKKAAAEEGATRVRLGRPGNSLKLGIVGMPNVGKSTTFNTLAKLNVPAQNLPFCTIDPNVATVAVPDQRFNWLCEHYQPASRVPPVVTITDIAGLVRGASEGEGVGNEFLSHIRAVDAIYHVVRAFADAEITHVEGDVDALRDLELINNELLEKDKEIIARAIESMSRIVDRGAASKDKKREYEVLQRVAQTLEEGQQVRNGTWNTIEVEVLNKHQLLTAKTQVILVNLSKRDYLRKKNRWLPLVRQWCDNGGAEVIIPFSADFETELVDMEINEGPEAVAAYKEANPTHKSALPRILRQGYAALGLQHYYTCGADEVRGWTVRIGALAPEAAGVIHTDFQRGFIMADIFSYDDLKELGSEAAVKTAGKLRQQGKRYEMQDGDIAHFKFNT